MFVARERKRKAIRLLKAQVRRIRASGWEMPIHNDTCDDTKIKGTVITINKIHMIALIV